MSDEIRLVVDGQIYSGWKTARVSRSVEQGCGSFELTVSEKWANRDKPWPIGENAPCVLKIGDEKLITGFLGKRTGKINKSSHSVTLRGRDAMCDVVDCSANLTASQFKQLDLQGLAEKLCHPHGVSVIVQPGLVLAETPTKRKKKTAFNPGDTSWAVLEQACRMAGVLAHSDGQGNLVITRAGKARALVDLVEGGNLLDFGWEIDWDNRFRDYEVRAQHQGSDDFMGESAAHVSGAATDPEVRSNRKLVIRAEHGMTQALASKRAQWEASTRAARSVTVSTTVQGWRQRPRGPLWRLNQLTNVHLPSARIKGDMLITGVTFAIDDQGGTTTELALKRRDAFRPDPTIAAGNGGNTWWPEIVRGV